VIVFSTLRRSRGIMVSLGSFTGENLDHAGLRNVGV
jgi:hypothetical protein